MYLPCISQVAESERMLADAVAADRQHAIARAAVRGVRDKVREAARFVASVLPVYSEHASVPSHV